MEILLLSIGCIVNSVAIILHLVSHRRGNRKGKGLTVEDLRRADALQKYYDKIVYSPNPFERLNVLNND